MGAKYPTGIRPHGAGIQIRFTWQKQRYEPIWPFKPTPKRIVEAEKLRADIISRAKLGVLTLEYLAEYFPEYKTIQEPGGIEESESYLFGNYAQTYLNTANLAPTTRRQYKNILNKIWMPLFRDRDIRTIMPIEIRKGVSDIIWSSPRNRNISIVPIRNIFKVAVEDFVIERNPTESLKTLSFQRPEIDPFTSDERDKLLTYLNKKYTGSDRFKYLFVKLAFWTGMRTSETLALQWTDIDWNQGYIHVSKGMVKGTLRDSTKTKVSRKVLLNDYALEALVELKQWTYLQQGPLFISAKTGRAFTTDHMPREVLTVAMRKTGIRHRPAYNTRHTYATVCLMAGMNPAFIAKQLGHSVRTLLTTYARWVDGAADAYEMAKLGKNLGKSSTGDL